LTFIWTWALKVVSMQISTTRGVIGDVGGLHMLTRPVYARVIRANLYHLI